MPKQKPPREESTFRDWLAANAFQALQQAGIGKGQIVLDYGCGSGTFAVPAAKLVGGRGKVYAADTDAKALRSVRERTEKEGLKNVETVLLDASSSGKPFQKESFDAILLYDVLQLIEDKRSLLRELHAILKPFGFLSIFPMHIGSKKMLQIAEEDKLFSLRDTHGMILNFSRARPEGGRSVPVERIHG